MRLPIVWATVVLAGASVVCGQEKQENTQGYEAAVIPVKTLSGDSFQRLARLLNAFGARYTFDDKLRTIVVYAPKEVVTQMRQVVEQLDRPGSDAALGKNIEAVLTFLRCSSAPQPDTGPLPPDLEPVAKQLRAVSLCRSVHLWELMPLRLQEGRQTQQSFRLPHTIKENPEAFSYANVRLDPEAVRVDGSGRYVRFASVAIDFRLAQPTSPPGATGPAAGQFQMVSVGLKTAGDFKEGQKTVLGKISGIDDQSAVFVVISLKVLD